MNKDRRTRIETLITKLDEISGELTELMTEERDAFDNMPEGLQQSENGQACESAADALDNASGELESLVSSLQEASSV